MLRNFVDSHCKSPRAAETEGENDGPIHRQIQSSPPALPGAHQISLAASALSAPVRSCGMLLFTTWLNLATHYLCIPSVQSKFSVHNVSNPSVFNLMIYFQFNPSLCMFVSFQFFLFLVFISLYVFFLLFFILIFKKNWFCFFFLLLLLLPRKYIEK